MKMICAGIDAGSRAIKVALFDARAEEIIATGIADQGIQQALLAQKLLEQVLGESDLHSRDLNRIVATGYGRNSVSIADTTITEITCQACGVYRQIPEVATVIEIGGQDSKVLRLHSGGEVRDFAMNDRCAAGTGRFLEMVADRLQVSIDKLGELAAQSHTPAILSSMCAVFAETEIIGLLAEGASPVDIAAGALNSVATRVATMTAHATAPIIFTGGVALIDRMDHALSQALGKPVMIAKNPQFTGAIGAAVLAARQLKSGNGSDL
jgi:(R)-2-hydroxyacyl-CoA dehydratese activating ATPase